MSVKVSWQGKTLKDIAPLAKRLLNEAPRAAGVIAVRHFKQNFVEGGFDGEKWAKRKRDKTPGRAVLVKRGHLRNSVKVIRVGSDQITIGSNEKYAQIHNDGGTIKHPGGTPFFMKDNKAVFVKNKTADRFYSIFKNVLPKTKPHDIPMPKRQFMGNSEKLNVKITDWIRNRMTQLLTK